MYSNYIKIFLIKFLIFADNLQMSINMKEAKENLKLLIKAMKVQEMKKIIYNI